MVDAAKLLGVDVMTGHWEFTYGAARVKEVVETDFAGRIDFIAQNVRTADFGDAGLSAVRDQDVNGVPVAIVGQAFPYTPIANPRYFVPDWTFGIQEESLQKAIDDARAEGRASGRAAVAQRHGRRPEARVARVGHRRDSRRTYARRRAATESGRESRRQDARHECGQQRQVPRSARARREERQGGGDSLSVGAGVRAVARTRSRRWTR